MRAHFVWVFALDRGEGCPEPSPKAGPNLRFRPGSQCLESTFKGIKYTIEDRDTPNVHGPWISHVHGPNGHYFETLASGMLGHITRGFVRWRLPPLKGGKRPEAGRVGI